jgi:catechol 2,3-dioxygenase-like lactoylglutathione lyase family enzyme
MAITELNHFFVRAKDLEETRRFYCDGLGLEVLPRPSFSFPGYWLGINDKAIVHMGPADDPRAQQHYSHDAQHADHSGAVDHIAFSASDPGQFVRRLRGMGVQFHSRYIPEVKVFQLVVTDPNGISVELNFGNIDSEPVIE